MGKLLSSSGLENVYLTMALQGDYSFASTIDDYDLSVLYNDVKRLGYKENIVDALFQAFHIINPFFTFQLVYSLEKYKDLLNIEVGNVNVYFIILCILLLWSVV